MISAGDDSRAPGPAPRWPPGSARPVPCRPPQGQPSPHPTAWPGPALQLPAAVRMGPLPLGGARARAGGPTPHAARERDTARSRGAAVRRQAPWPHRTAHRASRAPRPASPRGAAATAVQGLPQAQKQAMVAAGCRRRGPFGCFLRCRRLCAVHWADAGRARRAVAARACARDLARAGRRLMRTGWAADAL
jgi:hypothetical protein